MVIPAIRFNVGHTHRHSISIPANIWTFRYVIPGSIVRRNGMTPAPKITAAPPIVNGRREFFLLAQPTTTRKFHAYSRLTGKIIWENALRLPATRRRNYAVTAVTCGDRRRRAERLTSKSGGVNVAFAFRNLDSGKRSGFKDRGISISTTSECSGQPFEYTSSCPSGRKYQKSECQNLPRDLSAARSVRSRVRIQFLCCNSPANSCRFRPVHFM